MGENPTDLMTPMLPGHFKIIRSVSVFQPFLYEYLKTFTPFSPAPATAILAIAPVSIAMVISWEIDTDPEVLNDF